MILSFTLTAIALWNHKFGKVSPTLTFMGPCIVIDHYSKTNQMHQCIKFILFGMTLYMFRTVFPSIIRSSRLYIQQQAYVKQLLLSAY